MPRELQCVASEGLVSRVRTITRLDPGILDRARRSRSRFVPKTFKSLLGEAPTPLADRVGINAFRFNWMELSRFRCWERCQSRACRRRRCRRCSRSFGSECRTGAEDSLAIEPGEVTATIVEYRPIYINGDVARPGEQVYRPLMTVRQAAALSGGYDVMRLRMSNPILETADLRGEYKSLWTEYAKEQAHVWRLKQELGQETTVDQTALLDVPIARSTALAIVNVETEHLKTRQADQQAERTFLQRGIAEAEQIRILSEQQKTEDQGTQADVEELERAKELFHRGTLPSLRVNRRASRNAAIIDPEAADHGAIDAD